MCLHYGTEGACCCAALCKNGPLTSLKLNTGPGSVSQKGHLKSSEQSWISDLRGASRFFSIEYQAYMMDKVSREQATCYHPRARNILAATANSTLKQMKGNTFHTACSYIYGTAVTHWWRPDVRMLQGLFQFYPRDSHNCLLHSWEWERGRPVCNCGDFSMRRQAGSFGSDCDGSWTWLERTKGLLFVSGDWELLFQFHIQ